MNGFFLINKEKNMSSHDVIYLIKKKLNLNKIGHTGILDPMAEGLLIVLINKATKLAFLFENLDKTYQGSILFNKNFDTLDVTGKIIETKKNILSIEEVEKSFLFFLKKKYLQVPPMYSAIKIKGKKMYNLARKNIQIDIPPRKVHIKNLKITSSFENDLIDFETKVSKGTYIRSLARDIATQMNTYGALKKLTRTKIGSYNLKKAQNIHSVDFKNLIDVKILFKKTKKIILNDYLIKLVKNGVLLDERQILTKKSFIVLDQNKNWIAYYKPIQKNKYYPKYFF
ncbi:tRNA pseudouridine synthase TruB [Candidatus Phytoplasma rubi]|uniref:tRNA pseudouridine synthase B n=1 Tax=Candidatus Phytoplasma rubi TaxID=399025 RepID=A0ABY7BRY4_9MOLU|nr:tRNA pseudouridine(55) synthase TruB [Candidatus Phytoplasma rubi]WAN63289.1 tRNA pseudouridine synthase TruB [Candidatus Phytoplasma rubi]